MQKREFTDLGDLRLLYRGNKILGDLFSKSVHSIRQVTKDESVAKGFYLFLQNDRVSEEGIVSNLASNCKMACKGKYVVCLQDTTEINLSSHSKRIKKDSYIATTSRQLKPVDKLLPAGKLKLNSFAEIYPVSQNNSGMAFCLLLVLANHLVRPLTILTYSIFGFPQLNFVSLCVKDMYKFTIINGFDSVHNGYTVLF